MRHLALFGLTTVLGLSTLLTLPPAATWADDEVDITEDEGVTIAPIAPYPRHPRTDIDLVKPPTLLGGEGFSAVWATQPETIQVAEPFTIDLDLLNGDSSGPLILEPGTNVDIVLQQRHGHCALYIPVTLGSDGYANVPEMLILPYSGGYEAWLYFQPAGASEPVVERIAMFVEGVAENGSDITARPRAAGKWMTMPRYTKEVNNFIAGPTLGTAPRADNDMIVYEVTNAELEDMTYDDYAEHRDDNGRATLFLQSKASYVQVTDNPRDTPATSSFTSEWASF